MLYNIKNLQCTYYSPGGNKNKKPEIELDEITTESLEDSEPSLHEKDDSALNEKDLVEWDDEDDEDTEDDEKTE